MTRFYCLRAEDVYSVKKAMKYLNTAGLQKDCRLLTCSTSKKDEKVTAMIPIDEFTEDHYLFFSTKQGVIKRTSIMDYANIRANGLIALGLREEDELISVRSTDGTSDIAICTKHGMMIRFAKKISVRSAELLLVYVVSDCVERMRLLVWIS